MRYHTYIKIFFACLFVGFAGCAYYFYTDDSIKATDYTQVPDLSAAYSAETEIKEAKKKLADPSLQPATVVTHNVDGKKQLALTFDGLPRKTTLDRLLDVLDKHHAQATFFAEGGNVASDKTLIEALNTKGQAIGNYTYIGMAKLNQMPQDEVIKELCMAQKVFKVTSNFEPELFKAPKTNYDVPLLKIGAACGLQSAVKSDVYLNTDAVTSDVEAEKQVAQIKPGSIVSIVIGRPLEYIEQKQGKIDDRPAIDKQPLLELGKRPAVKHEDIVEATDRFLTACEKQGVEIVALNKMRKVKMVAEPAQEDKAAKFANRVSLLLHDSLTNFMGRAYAAPKKKGFVKKDYSELQKQNNGQLAEEQKMIYTTEQAMAFCFAGFTNPQSTNAVLDRMQKLGIHGTFFVGARDIKKYPETMQRIVDDGHELAIAVYSLKGADFNSVCNDIAQTRELLRTQYGVETNLVKQPWGKIEDFTREAVAAMGCQLITQNVNVVQSRHKDYTDPHSVLSEIIGKAVHSLGRGWIINFRMDYYTEPTLCADVMQLLKEKKVDNIAYWEFDDDPKNNPHNDSAYVIKGVGALLANKQYLYKLPAPEDIPEKLKPENNYVADENIRQYLQKRYIGGIDLNLLGFTGEDKRYLDTSGVVLTNRPVVFLGFDDWGNDASVNHVLYVLRKHRVKGTFFILTANMLNNPNLLRAIAVEGHDIGCHTNTHKPLVLRGPHRQLYAAQSREDTFADMATGYAKLASVVGDVQVDGKYALTRYFRPPTLALSKMGVEAIKNAGYEFIVSGCASIHDYRMDNLYQMIDEVRDGLYDGKKVRNGSTFVIHMTAVAKYTARALDILLTQNEKKADDDPTKFEVGRLSDYLVDGYDQSKKTTTLKLQKQLGN